ncbi:14725_t:CDS:2, partial [Dentiscutata heterogama]
WGDLTPPKLPEPSKLPELEEGLEERAKPYKEITTELDFNEYYLHILAYGSTCWLIEGQLAGQKCTKTFYYNSVEYYTHYDIQMAIDLGLHIELSSESPNALIFEPNQLMYRDEIFYQ